MKDSMNVRMTFILPGKQSKFIGTITFFCSFISHCLASKQNSRPSDQFPFVKVIFTFTEPHL